MNKNKCAIRDLEGRPGDKPDHKYQVNYNLSEYGWLGRKTFRTIGEAEDFMKEKGFEVIE